MTKRFCGPVVQLAKLPPIFTQKATFANAAPAQQKLPIWPPKRPHRKATIAFFDWIDPFCSIHPTR
jgi:hypothetical protein